MNVHTYILLSLFFGQFDDHLVVGRQVNIFSQCFNFIDKNGEM